jgi:hypothetical protein
LVPVLPSIPTWISLASSAQHPYLLRLLHGWGLPGKVF